MREQTRTLTRSFRWHVKWFIVKRVRRVSDKPNIVLVSNTRNSFVVVARQATRFRKINDTCQTQSKRNPLKVTFDTGRNTPTDTVTQFSHSLDSRCRKAIKQLCLLQP